MGSLNLSLNNPLFELPHRVGMQGLAKLLDYCDRTQSLASTSITWDISETQINIYWKCSDYEFFDELNKQAYQLKDGEIDSPCLELDDEERAIYSQGILNSFLQHNGHRKFTDEKQVREFMVLPDSLPITRTVRILRDYFYLSNPSKVFTKKGMFIKKIPLKSNHLPGLIEEPNGAGTYQGSLAEFIALHFLPLATAIYSLPMDLRGFRVAMCFIDTNNLLDSVNQKIPRQFIDSTVTSGGDACLRILANNQNQEVCNLNHEVYILGTQQWNSRQKFLKQEVLRIKSSDYLIDLYSKFLEMLSPKYRLKIIKDKAEEKQQPFISGSGLLGYISDNLIKGKPWHYKLGQYLLTRDYYEKETLIKMIVCHSEEEYRDYLNIVQQAFNAYLDKTKVTNAFGHYARVRHKAIHLLNSARNKQGFSKAFTQFLVLSELVIEDEKALKLVNNLIETNWGIAKDWALQAILLHTPPTKQNNLTEVATND